MSPLVVDGDGALLHLLDQRAVGRVGAAERVDAFAGRVGDEQRIHLAVADGPQRLLGLGQARAQSSSSTRSRSCAVVSLVGPIARPEVQPEQHPLRVGHVADDPAQRQRQLLDQRRRRDDLLALRQRRLLIDVDDLELVAALRDAPRRSSARFRRRESTAASCRSRRDAARSARSAARATAWSSVVSRVILDRASSLGRSLRCSKIQPDQHPFGVRQVADDLLDRRGQPAHQGRQREDLIAAARAADLSSRSITSIRYRPARCSSQIFRRFANARSAFGVWPAT